MGLGLTWPLTEMSTNYITILCRRQAEIIHNHENENVRNIGQSEIPHRKHKSLNLAAVFYTTVQVSRLLR
jgi:hypothetical protein